MWKVGILLALFSLNTYSFEAPIHEFIEFMEKGQDKLLGPKFTDPECHDCQEDTEGFNLQRCYDAICGSVFEVPSFGDTNQFNTVTCLRGEVIGETMVDKAVFEVMCDDNPLKRHYPGLKAIDDKMKAFYEKEIKLTGHKIKGAIHYLKTRQNTNSPLDNFNTNLSDLITYVSNTPGLLELDDSNPHEINMKFKGGWSFRRKLRKSFNLSGSEAKVAEKALKAIFEDSNSFLALEFLGSDYVLKNLMTGRGLSGNPDKALRDLKFANLTRLQGVLGSQTIDQSIIRGTAEEKAMVRDDVLSEVLSIENLLNNLSAEDVRTLSRSNFTKESFYNKKKFEKDWSDPMSNKYLSTLEHLEVIQNLYLGDDEKATGGETYNYMVALLAALEHVPSSEELEEVKKKVPGFIDNFFKTLEADFSGYSIGVIKNEINKVHIDFPRSKEEYLKEVSDWLDSRISSADAKLGQLRDPANISAKSFYGREYLQAILLGQGSEGALNEILPVISVNPIPDFYIGAYNGIKMGPFAVNNFDTNGSQVLAHELGHHLGHFMESNQLSLGTAFKFKAVRECLASSHKEEALGFKKAPVVNQTLFSIGNRKHEWKENFYSEEDFADWIGAKTTSKNMACAFASPVNMDNIDPRHKLVNQNSKDNHSSGFFRLLNIEYQQKGRLPKNCQNEFIKKCPETQAK